jgi:hypothetical protein
MTALGLTAGLVGTVAILYGMAAVMPVNLRLTIADSTLVVEPLVPDRFLTFRRRIEVPLGAVISVRVVPRREVSVPFPRILGTHLPGVCTAGSFGRGEERVFWDVRRADAVLVINCAAGQQYRTLVLEFAEPDLVAARVRDALAH